MTKKAPKAQRRQFSLEAPDQARLKLVRAIIERILREHDLAGAVVLHTPGMSEWFFDIAPSYSVAHIDLVASQFSLRSKLEDYAGDADAQLLDLQASANMLKCLSENLRAGAVMFEACSQIADQKLNATHTEGVLVPDPAEAQRH